MPDEGHTALLRVPMSLLEVMQTFYGECELRNIQDFFVLSTNLHRMFGDLSPHEKTASIAIYVLVCTFCRYIYWCISLTNT